MSTLAVFHHFTFHNHLTYSSTILHVRFLRFVNISLTIL